MAGGSGVRGGEGRWRVGWVEEEEREDGGWVGWRKGKMVSGSGGRGGEGRWWVGQVEEEEREDGGWVGWKRERKRVMHITFHVS